MKRKIKKNYKRLSRFDRSIILGLIIDSIKKNIESGTKRVIIHEHVKNCKEYNYIDSYLYLRDNKGAELAFDDNSGEGDDPLISFTAKYSGSYYLDVGDVGNDHIGKYTLYANLLSSNDFSSDVNTQGKIKIGTNIYDQSYLVGRVVEVNYNTSRVLLLSDLNSNVPVTIAPQNIQAIMIGGGKDNGEIKYIKDGIFKKFLLDGFFSSDCIKSSELLKFKSEFLQNKNLISSNL